MGSLAGECQAFLFEGNTMWVDVEVRSWNGMGPSRLLWGRRGRLSARSRPSCSILIQTTLYALKPWEVSGECQAFPWREGTPVSDPNLSK